MVTDSKEEEEEEEVEESSGPLQRFELPVELEPGEKVAIQLQFQKAVFPRSNILPTALQFRLVVRPSFCSDLPRLGRRDGVQAGALSGGDRPHLQCRDRGEGELKASLL